MCAEKRRHYEPPRARDLSSMSASGAKPLGSCESGGHLTSGECKNGSKPVGGTCGPTGFVPERGYCRTGDQAVEGCTSGSIHH
jgi:hypothetical protein